ncbi:hypothetical protein LEP1GSC016_4269 [Leptospira borgpetersenii serovar Hardjo-bovis str. Sponselee]|uniref:Uncharacterized protein n=1 Tax=Leptospira borgpetersenii serovar Hardjo-bovis str. Sponselee TaxID=1303729 RepID=M6BXX6_LEPBO|nr:hypothetical protein LEP1GSC016_4269 [Leptospira borgpetersenii serovar Hardjo-bovis str. Sponselee]
MIKAFDLYFYTVLLFYYLQERHQCAKCFLILRLILNLVFAIFCTGILLFI